MPKFKSVNRKLLLVVVFTVAWMLGMMIVVYFTYLYKTPAPIENWTPPPATVR